MDMTMDENGRRRDIHGFVQRGTVPDKSRNIHVDLEWKS
jgi:hypothetical protein